MPRAKQELLDSNPIHKCRLPISVMETWSFLWFPGWTRTHNQHTLAKVHIPRLLLYSSFFLSGSQMQRTSNNSFRAGKLLKKKNPKCCTMNKIQSRSHKWCWCWSCFCPTTRETRSYIPKSPPILLLLTSVPLQAEKLLQACRQPNLRVFHWLDFLQRGMTLGSETWTVLRSCSQASDLGPRA